MHISIFFWPESYYHGTVNIGDTMAIGIQKYNAATKIEKLFYKSVWFLNFLKLSILYII